MSNPADKWLTIREAADALSVSRATLNRWLAEGLPDVRLPGRGKRPMRRVPIEAARAWVLARARAR